MPAEQCVHAGLWSGDKSINIITNALIHSRVWSAILGGGRDPQLGVRPLRVHPSWTVEAFNVNFYPIIQPWHHHYQVNNFSLSAWMHLVLHAFAENGRRCLLECSYLQCELKKKEKTELGFFVCLSLNKTKIFMFRSERTNRKDGECDWGRRRRVSETESRWKTEWGVFQF